MPTTERTVARPARSERLAGSGAASGGTPVVLHAAALVLFVATVGALLVPKLVPAQPGRFLANSPADGAIFLWDLGWWPYAVAHGIVLPYTHALFAPGGTNLAWTTSIPVPALLVAPITRLFGVFVAFDVLALLAPISAAWVTYLLVYRVTRTWWTSVAAGAMFAVSPLEMAEVGIGHLNLSLVALVPLAAYLVIRRLDGSLGSRAFVLSLGVVVAAQLGVSTEVLLSTTLFGGIALLLLYAFDPARRPALRRCGRLIGLGYLVAGALASPMIYAAVAMPHPPGLASAGGSAAPMSGVRTTIGPGVGASLVPVHPSVGISRFDVAVLTIPLIGILVHLAWTRRAEPVVRALTITALIALACSAGVVVVGTTSIPTPWALMQHLPLFGLVRPQRMTMFFWLIAAVGLGVWLAERGRSVGRWAIVAFVIAAMLAPVWSGRWTSVIRTPPALAAGSRYLGPGDDLLVVAEPPGPGSHRFDDLALPAVWQARSGFAFRLADAYVGSFPPRLPSMVQRLVFRDEIALSAASAFRAWLRRAGVTDIMLMRPTPSIEARLDGILGSRPLRLSGRDLYVLRARAR